MPFEPSEVLLKEAGDKYWLLLERLKYSDPAGASYEIPHPYGPEGKNFETDLASVPSVCTWIIPRYGRHTKAALIHDHLCRLKEFERFEADRVFRHALKELGVGAVRRFFMGWAVTWGSLLGAFAMLRTYVLLTLSIAVMLVTSLAETWSTALVGYLERWEPAVCGTMPPQSWLRTSTYVCASLPLLGNVVAWVVVVVGLPSVLAAVAGSLSAKPRYAGDIAMTLVATVLATPILIGSLFVFAISLIYRGFGFGRGALTWNAEVRPIIEVPRFVLTGTRPVRRGEVLESQPTEKNPLQEKVMSLAPPTRPASPRAQRIAALFN